MSFSTDLVVKLREKTGAGMMDCKKALTEANGDLDKAVEILRKKGVADAAKKSTRATKEGVIEGFKSPDGKKAGMIELDCETDFVAKNREFQVLAAKIAEMNAESGHGEAPDIHAYDSLLKEQVGKFGENLILRKAIRFELSGPGLLSFYVHPSGRKVGAMVEFSASSDAVAAHPEAAAAAKTVLFQIAGAPSLPRFLKREEAPAAEIEKEKEIHTEILKKEGKPEASIPKIVEGKLNKLFYQQFCLLEQLSILDNKTPISKVVEDAGAKAGGKLELKRFVRYQVGEQ